MTEDQQAVEKKKEVPSNQKRMSKIINNTLGMEIEWDKLTDRDLKALYNIVTNDRRLRKLAIRILRKRIHGLGHQAKQGVKEIARDIITESGIGEKALKILTGEDEEDDGLEDKE